jgi:hypothetical protein
MPCRSDYLEPTAAERETNKVAKLIIYVKSALDSRWNASPILEMAAEATYPDTSLLDQYTAVLCSDIKGMNEEQKTRILYDGRFKQARELADWWERHQELDKNRNDAERQAEWFTNNLKGLVDAEFQLLKAGKIKTFRYNTILEWVKNHTGE